MSTTITTASNPIRPIFLHKIHIQNGFKYRDFYRRRYKTTLHYKFTYPKEMGMYPKQDDKKTQKNLCKILKFIKFAKTIDFLNLKSREQWISQHLQLLIFKRISKTENVSFKTSRNYQMLFDNFAEKGLKYLPRIRKLFYIFEIGWYHRNVPFIRKEVKNPLRTLRNCPAIESITIKITPLPHAILPPNCFRDFSRYPSKLKHFDLQEKFALSFATTSINSLKNLKSIQFPFGQYHPKNRADTLDGFSNLANLQELSLKFQGYIMPEIYPPLTKIAERGVLKKLSLNFDFALSGFLDPLAPLERCQLTHFSLTSQVSQGVKLQGIAKLLQRNNQLEYLKLDLFNNSFFAKDDCLKSVCQEIGNLQALRHLKLIFKAESEKGQIRLQNPVPELQDIFKKPISLETFTLECNQMDTPLVLFSLIDALEPSSSAIHKLKIDLGAYSPDKRSQVAITNFMQRLVNIRVLKLLCFDLSAKTFLSDIVKAVYGLKYLRVLVLRNFIKGTITKNLVIEAIGTILRKKGLRKFKYDYDQEFEKKVMEKESKKIHRINLKQLLRDNPCLEDTPLDYSTLEMCHYRSELNW